MKTIATLAAVATLALGAASAAQAQTVPNPANPAPLDAIATDGSLLPPAYVPASPYRGVYSGRSVAVDVGRGDVARGYGPVGFAADTAGAAVGAAGSVVDGVTRPIFNGRF